MNDDEDLARVTFWKAINDSVHETVQVIVDLTGERDALQAEVESLMKELDDLRDDMAITRDRVMQLVCAHAIATTGRRYGNSHYHQLAQAIADELGLNLKDYGFASD